MKITEVRTTLVDVPLEKPIRSAIHDIRSVGCVLVWLDTDDGITGESYLFGIGPRWLKVFREMVRALADHVTGCDPHDTEAMWAEMWATINTIGHKGVSVLGIAALDTACWDIVGRAAHGMPVYKLLGAIRDRIPAYASGGLWLSYTLDELQAEAREFKAQGFRAMKMRLGKPSVTEDTERVAAVREAIGPEIALMADANQGFETNHAIRFGRAIERYNLTWFEEPVPAYDLDGHAQIAAEIDTPIASGESEYARYGFAQMLEKGAADILMPDLQRVGGISEFVKVANMAAGWDVPVSPHIFTEQSLQLCGAIANCCYSEHMPWFAPLFNEQMEMAEGSLLIPDRPGLGFTFDAEAVERFRIDG